MRIPSLLALATLLARTTAAQGPPTIPIRTLGPILKVGTAPVGPLVGIRALSDGRVLVNDGQKKQLVLLDATLSNPIVVADTTSGTQKAYGKAGASMTPYLGDSTLFIDQTSLAVLVIDPSGKIARTFAVPRAADIRDMTSPGYADPGFDGKGGLIYRKAAAAPPGYLAAAMAAHTPMVSRQDSAFVLRGEIASHRIDTIGVIRLGGNSSTITFGADGTMSMRGTMTPTPTVDDWTVTADGSVALVRGGDFHVDWVSPDGAKSSSPRIPFDWQRLSDSAKGALVDSMKAVIAREPDTITTTINGVQRKLATPPRSDVVQPSELPDYRPPFGPVSAVRMARADAEGNIWIPTNLPGEPRGAPPVYDVINRKGALVDRVRLLPGFTLVGFGPGIAYLSSRNDQGTGVLSTARTR